MKAGEFCCFKSPAKVVWRKMKFSAWNGNKIYGFSHFFSVPVIDSLWSFELPLKARKWIHLNENICIGQLEQVTHLKRYISLPREDRNISEAELYLFVFHFHGKTELIRFYFILFFKKHFALDERKIEIKWIELSDQWLHFSRFTTAVEL